MDGRKLAQTNIPRNNEPRQHPNIEFSHLRIQEYKKATIRIMPDIHNYELDVSITRISSREGCGKKTPRK